MNLHELTNALSSHKDATVAGCATVLSGFINWLDLVNDILGLVAVVSGIILTSILIRKHSLELKINENNFQKRREEDIDG